MYAIRSYYELARKGIEVAPLLESLQVHYLEDFKQTIGRAEQIALLAAALLLPARLLYGLFGKPVSIEQSAAILFSSGSEGDPKGVVLSHRNILGNIRQVSDVLDTREEDVITSYSIHYTKLYDRQ